MIRKRNKTDRRRSMVAADKWSRHERERIRCGSEICCIFSENNNTSSVAVINVHVRRTSSVIRPTNGLFYETEINISTYFSHSEKPAEFLSEFCFVTSRLHCKRDIEPYTAESEYFTWTSTNSVRVREQHYGFHQYHRSNPKVQSRATGLS